LANPRPLPALLPARPLAIVLKDLFGFWNTPVEFWTIIASIVVALPFSYLPARITFARLDREFVAAARGLGFFQKAFRIFLPAAWTTVALSVSLATARTFRAYAGEALAPLPAVLVVAVPSVIAACLISYELSRQRPKA
jgi:ABC-type spermidine/putrescine transport system permease subunit II